ncbi:MAG: N-acetyltransferase [Pseudomonadota bacterium]
MFRLLTETSEDVWEIEALLDTAFGPGRTGLSSYRLREGVEPVAALCRIARDEFDAVVGAIRCWPVRVGALPALLLGPVAVHPTRQGEGLGALLIEEALARGAEEGWSRVLLVGDAPYYGRFGFRRDLAARVNFPPPTNPDRVLARELRPGAMAGVSGEVTRAVD